MEREVPDDHAEPVPSTACHDASDEIWTLGRLLLSRSSNEQALQIELLAM
jgi:hypothetical protein